MKRYNAAEWKLEIINVLPNVNTRRNYESTLRMLEAHFNPFKGNESALQLMKFVRAQQGSGVSPQTLKQRVSILKNIIEQAKTRKIRTDSPVEKNWAPKIKITTKPKCPTKQELVSLDKAINAEPGFLGARNRAMIGLMRYEGLRVHEVTSLNHEDFYIQRSKVELTVKGKGGFKTTIELYPQSVELIAKYKKYIPQEFQKGPFFIPAFEPNKRLDGRTVRKTCNQVFKKAGWRSGLSCHSLRHSLSVQLLENGVPITEVQRKLRHRFISSTFTYYSNVPCLRNAEKLSTAYKFLGGI